jgi:hypothetical protein
MNTRATDRAGFSFFGALFRAVLISVFVLVLPTAASAAAVISAVGLLLNAQVAFNGEVATFTSNDSPAQPAPTYSATISWGDGSPASVASITGPAGGVFSVKASHTYAAAGTYTMTVLVTDSFDSTTVPATTTLTVLPSI